MYIPLFIMFCMTNNLVSATQKAFFTVPVADLVGSTMNIDHYVRQPVCGIPEHRYAASPRLHQARYNEVVDVLEQQGQWTLIALPQVYYTPAGTTERSNRYWTLSRNLMTFDELRKKGLDIHHIPDPIDFTTGIPTHEHILTLVMPYHDKNTGLTFSSGTRFVLVDQQIKNGKYHVYAFEAASFSFKVIALPAHYALLYKALSLQERIELFVKTLQAFTRLGCIPYVLGGCSVATVLNNLTFTTQTATFSDKPLSFFAVDGHNETPKTGLDCSNAISLAAHIVGLPYYFKNTTTLMNNSPGLKHNESLTPGDLIVIKGHVMIVSDTVNNLLIEARGYEHGYGKLQEIALEKVFKNMHSYNDLEQAYFQHKPLERLDRQGNVRDTFATFKLIKLVNTLKHPTAA